MVSLIFVFSALLLACIIVGGVYWANKNKVNHEIIRKILAAVLVLVTLVRYLIDREAISVVRGLNMYSPFLDNAVQTALSLFLVWFTFASLLCIVMDQVYYFKSLRNITRFFSIPVLALDLIFFKTYATAISGTAVFDRIDARAILLAIEIGLGLGLVISRLVTDKEHLPTKREIGTMLKILPFAIMAFMPTYALQLLFGYINPSIKIDDFSFEHRIILYLGILIPFSIVTGSEAWFVANNATDIATQIKALNGLLQPAGGSFLTTLPNNPDTMFFNAIMVNMKYVSDASSVFSSDDLDGAFSIGNKELLDMNDSAYGNFGNPYVSGYAAHASLGKAPIFQSSNGTVGVGIMGTSTGLNAFNPTEQATGMAVGSQGGYTIVIPNGTYQSSDSNSTGLAPSDTALYSGDYITTYYNNIGLVFGYNENPDSITEY